MISFRAVVVAVVLALLVVPARPEAPRSTGWADEQAPGFYRLGLGDFKISSVGRNCLSRFI